jgi:hypothetical protein
MLSISNSLTSLVCFMSHPPGNSLKCLLFVSGLVQNADKEVIKVVRELVEFYIEKKDTIILVTIPMSGATLLRFLPADNY